MIVGPSIRATSAEAITPLPGDSLVAAPIGVVTHAITIKAPPEQVWPWVAQMGAGSRAGWYSYDRLDNGGVPSARRIIPELQQIAVGDLFPALPGARDAFFVITFEPFKTLVLGVPARDGGFRAHWTFALARSDGNTRLLVRGSFGYRILHLPRPVMRAVGRLLHFIMERKQLLGIKQRVERVAHARALLPA